MHPGAATTGMAIVTFWANYVRLWTAGDYALLLFVVLALLYIWFLFNDPRDKAMPQVAARLGLHFSRKVSPDIIGAREAEFNEGGREFLNFMRGSIAGRETVIFDHWTQSKSETDVATQQTVVGFRIDPETCFREWGSIRAAHWRAEKNGRVGFRLSAPPLGEAPRDGSLRRASAHLVGAVDRPQLVRAHRIIRLRVLTE